MHITDDELAAIFGLKEFIDHPAKFGCTIDIGLDETYDERVGWLFEKADEAISAILARAPTDTKDAWTDAPSTDEDSELAGNVEKLRQCIADRVTAIKAALAIWLERCDNEHDSVCVTKALFEVALDRHVALYGADAFEFIESTYQRALKHRRGALH